MDFEFLLPTRIIMKSGIRHNTGEYLANEHCKKVLVISDQGIKNAGLLEDIFESLKEKDLEIEEFVDVKPNPRAEDCDQAAGRFRNENIDAILAVGGGSVMDTAKALSILLTHDGSIVDFEGSFPTKNDTLPVICIPTTAGTGSEVTFFSVITDTERKYKLSILDYQLGPKLALLDPELTASLPGHIAASTGMDALTHAIESYTCTVSSPITDGLALHAIKLIADNIVAAVHERVESSRENMLIGSLIAGMAFGNSDIGSVHCISEAIGGLYDTPHGVANSIFLPYVFKHNISANVKRHAEVGYALGADNNLPKEEAAKKATEILFELSDQVNIPKFNEIEHVNPDDFQMIAKVSKENISDPSNAKELSVEDYLSLLHEAYKGDR